MSKDTILLVEDHPDEAELALRGFAKMADDYDVQLARDGEEALDFLFSRGQHRGRPSARKPGLIILDLSLPGIDGFEVVQQLREHSDYRYTPVVVLTTSDEQSDILQSYNLGVNSYLCKPLDFENFSDVLQLVSHYWLRNNAAPRP
ncbi:response regulator [Marinimicrobium alkaliphilum]|uniref:response regulator n=1 Tax=Marinimicrobium alkaliphilum TaxID=2202654 RepID=UPI0018E08498|nr:response regulator [Marinimicrobium alkaliphilum]